VPDEAVNRGNSRSLRDTSACPLTSARTGPGLAAHVLLSSRSNRRQAQVTGQPFHAPAVAYAVDVAPATRARSTTVIVISGSYLDPRPRGVGS
jgi:hypothetical protein